MSDRNLYTYAESDHTARNMGCAAAIFVVIVVGFLVAYATDLFLIYLNI